MRRKTPAWKARLARALGRPERLAVLGVGNVSKGDDAAGVRAAEALARSAAAGPAARLKVFVTHDVPENFTGVVRAFRPSHVLVLDAAAAGFEPGAVFLVDPSGVPVEEVSTHRTPLATLVRYLEGTVGCRVIVLGFEPQDFSPRTPLTPPVRRAVGDVAAYLAGFAARRLRSSSASKRKYS
jgi:hydrogenase 3 maturation protease